MSRNINNGNTKKKEVWQPVTKKVTKWIPLIRYFDLLPDDIIKEICIYLTGIKDICAMRATCRLFRTILKSEFFVDKIHLSREFITWKYSDKIQDGKVHRISDSIITFFSEAQKKGHLKYPDGKEINLPYMRAGYQTLGACVTLLIVYMYNVGLVSYENLADTKTFNLKNDLLACKYLKIPDNNNE